MKVTLDDIRAAADKKYGDYEIDLGEDRPLVLRNALRLAKEQRATLFTLIDRVESTDGDDGDDGDDRSRQVDQIESQVTAIQDVVRLIAHPADRGEELLTAIGDDLPLLMEMFEGYMRVASPGEASPSES